ncbi:hypothetical protein SO802_001897 [Lithocarpus litseifolius]|uniref:protein-serine/threonine phosphatase n=1 Tax=Lithocarpus litseifolius TaxID=425828 RepID=A0AAW2DZ84_9ROSI
MVTGISLEMEKGGGCFDQELGEVSQKQKIREIDRELTEDGGGSNLSFLKSDMINLEPPLEVNCDANFKIVGDREVVYKMDKLHAIHVSNPMNCGAMENLDKSDGRVSVDKGRKYRGSKDWLCENQAVAITILWALWTNRIDVQHGGLRKNGKQLILWCTHYLEEYWAAVEVPMKLSQDGEIHLAFERSLCSGSTNYHCSYSYFVAEFTSTKCLVITSFIFLGCQESEIGFSGLKSPSNEKSGFLPIFRSGSCSEKGPKQYMEDEYISVDNLHEHLGTAAKFPSPCAFYGVFDGHVGIDAALFIKKNILNYIVEDSNILTGIKKAVKNDFVKADHAFLNASSLDSSSGTTALTALIMGRTMLIANAGDSRAVLGKRGRAIELSRDHKPNCTAERLRIEKLGGVVYDGYLNGQQSVARALGDWHIKGSIGSKCPLSSEPELEEILLSEEDEFLIIGALVKEALQRNTCDNLTVVVVCFSPDPPPKIEIPRSQKRRSISAEGLDLLKGVLNDL